MADNIFAVDIGGSKLICGALTKNGEILETYRVDFEKGYTLEALLEHIKKGYEQLKGYGFFASGAAIPGLCDPRSGKWLYSPFSGIADVPIVQKISEITGLTVYCDNDVNLSALAERHFGACINCDDFLWITVSNGIGGGLFLNGQLYRGPNMTSGEIGHFIVEEEGRPCGCGNKGCLEAMASGASISKSYTKLTGKSLSAKEIAALARSGDKTALSVWRQAGTYIGKAAAYAINLLGIETVVLGGGASQSFDLIEPSATEALERYVFKKANPKAKIIPSAVGYYAALKGCAALLK